MTDRLDNLIRIMSELSSELRTVIADPDTTLSEASAETLTHIVAESEAIAQALRDALGQGLGGLIADLDEQFDK
jgi:hypothetical protein